MSLLPDALQPAAIELDVAGGTEWDAIGEVTGLLRGNAAVIDPDRLRDEVIERERASSTATAAGVAFPHSRTSAVEKLVVALGRSREGIRFGQTGHLVHFIVVIGTPREMVREYLQLVAHLARRFKDAALREALLRASTAEEVVTRLGGDS
jgi:mannitol/fructose-specific phosphotransferase system IIA component (Ntr-type)